MKFFAERKKKLSTRFSQFTKMIPEDPKPSEPQVPTMTRQDLSQIRVYARTTMPSSLIQRIEVCALRGPKRRDVVLAKVHVSNVLPRVSHISSASDAVRSAS